MERKPLQRADGQRNRKRVLSTAARLLADDPDASIAAIADEAGLSRKSVYGHFASREALVAGLLEEDVRAIRDALDAADLDGGPAGQALARGMQAMAGPALRLRALRRVYEAVLGPATVRARRQWATESLIAVVARGQEEGVFRAELPPVVVEAVADGMSRGLSEAVDAGHLDAQEVPRHISEAMTRLLTPGHGSGPHRT